MLSRFLAAEGGQTGEPASAREADLDRDTASIRRTISELGSLPVERRRFLVGFAYILVRVARADAGVNDVEVARMEEAVNAAGSLPESQGALLVALAIRTSALYGGTEDYAVTRDFARTSTPQGRQRLLRACFAVGAADGVLTGAEIAELYEIGRELGFDVDEIDAVRDQVEPLPPDQVASED